MQKISTYLYPNRIELLADLATFNVEYTSVYQRIVKIYKGIDNTIEFDIKNADQKRIALNGLTIRLNVMDASGNSLPNSPYTVTALPIRGLASVLIPQGDLEALSDQYLKYSVTATNENRTAMILYCDTKFGAAGTIELIGNAMPTTKLPRVFNTFIGEIDYLGLVINHSSAIPAKLYEALPTEAFSFKIKLVNFVGEMWLEATTNDTISVNSFTNAAKLQTFTATEASPATSIVSFNNVTVGAFSYFRILYKSTAGVVESVTVEV